MDYGTPITARGYTPTKAALAECRRDRALSMLAFVKEALSVDMETASLNGAPLEGLVHILDAIETDLCEAHLLEAEK